MFRRDRLEFPIGIKREALRRSAGICECHRVPQIPTFRIGCGVRLGPGNTFFEHVTPDALRPDNSLANCAALCKTCWAAKSDTFDKPVIAEAKRRFDRHHGIKPTPREVLVGTFASGIKKSLSGAVLDRATGLPWHERNLILQPPGNGIIGPVTPLGHRVPVIEGEPT